MANKPKSINNRRITSIEFDKVTRLEWKEISNRFNVRAFDFFFKRMYPDDHDCRVKFLKALRDSSRHDASRHDMWAWWTQTRSHKLNLEKAGVTV